jgi:hypothetical protein
MIASSTTKLRRKVPLTSAISGRCRRRTGQGICSNNMRPALQTWFRESCQSVNGLFLVPISAKGRLPEGDRICYLGLQDTDFLR